MTRPNDTSRAADRRQLEAFRVMTPATRLRLADAMSTEIRALARAGIRARHPEYSTEEVDGALAELLLGRAMASGVLRSRRPVTAR
jgi:hypothetical protein